MKALLDRALCRVPRLYSRLLLSRQPRNLEKILFLRLLVRGEVVFDIGANAGNYTLLFSQVVGRKGQVHAFEPVPPTFASLERTLDQRRRSTNVFANRCALADEGGQREIFVPAGDPGQASLAQHRAGSWQQAGPSASYRCRVDTLDAYVRDRAIVALDFAKIDVEGAELLVLRGGRTVLAASRPLLYLEVCADWTTNLGYRPSDLATFLRGLGYDRFFLLGAGLRHLTDPERDLDAGALTGSANLLCGISSLHGARLDRGLKPLLELPA